MINKKATPILLSIFLIAFLNLNLKASENTSDPQMLFSNGPIANSFETGPDGTDMSIIPEMLHRFGFTIHKPNTSGIEYRVADSFVVDAPEWHIDSIEFFAFVAGGTDTERLFDRYTIQIWDGEPGDPQSILIWGNEYENRFLRSSFSGVYRQYINAPSPIISNMCQTHDLILPAGEYWIDWNGRAVPNSAEVVNPPLVPKNEVISGHGKAAMGREWEKALDTEFPQGFPFNIYGTAIKETNDIALLEIISPQSSEITENAETFSVKIKNNGTQPLEEFQVMLYVDESLLATETVTQQIAPGEILIYESEFEKHFSDQKTSLIKVELSTQGETFTKNNVQQKWIDKYEDVIFMSDDTVYLDFANFFDDGGPAENYSQNSEFVLTVYPESESPQARMSVEFLKMDLYFASAYLKVYNGPEVDWNKEIAQFGHGFVPEDISTLTSTDTTGALTFAFFSNNMPVRSGWNARLSTVQPLDHDLELIEVKIPNQIASQQEFPCRVSIRNNGLVASGEFKVNVYDDNNTLLAQHQGNHLQPDQTQHFTSVLSLDEAHSQYLKAVIQYEPDMNISNNTSSNVRVSYADNSEGLAIAGIPEFLGNNYPININQYNSVNQMLYFPDEIPQGITITDIAFQYAFEHKLNSSPTRIWIGETDLESLEGNYISPDELTLVFDDDISLEKGRFDVRFELSEPYHYTGRNLVVLIHRPFTRWSSSQNFFYCTNTPEREGRSLTTANSSFIIDVESPRYLRSSDVLPYTKFYFDNEQIGSLKGVVADENGNTLSKATISLDSSNYVENSGDNGLFWIREIPAGEYSVKVNRHNYSELIQDITIESGTVTEFNFQLEQAPLLEVSGLVKKFHDPAEGLLNASFQFSSNDTIITASSNQNGQINISGFPGNVTYNVRISHQEYKTEEFQLFIDHDSAILPEVLLKKRTAAVKEVVATQDNQHALIQWPPATSIYEIAYDNGLANGRTASGYSFAVRFTPEDYPVNIITARINVYQDGILSPDIPPAFEILIWDDSGPDGLPGSLLWSGTYDPDEFGWANVDIPGITINEGDFYIAVKKIGDDWMFFSRDNQTSTNSYIQNWEGANWQPYAYNYSTNFLFRAVVDGSAGSREMEPAEFETGVEGYNVYRFPEDQQHAPEEWELLAQNIDALEYTDTEWADLPYGVYNYAVKTYYTMGNLSQPTISNSLDNKMDVPQLSVQFLPFNGQDFEQLEFMLIPDNNDPDHFHTAVTNTNGTASISDVRKGNYSVLVKDRRFEPLEKQIFIEAGGLIEISLKNNPLPPLFVSAQTENNSASVSWKNRSELFIVAHDNGIHERHVSGGQSNAIWIGNKLNSDPGNLVAVEFYAERNPFTVSESVTIDVFDADTVLLGSSEPFEIVPDAWNQIPIDNLPVDGNFFAMVHFNQPQTAQHFLAVDTHGPEASLNLAHYYNGTQWRKLNSFYSTWPSCNVLLRALVDPHADNPGNLNIPADFNVYKLRIENQEDAGLWETVALGVDAEETIDTEWENYPWGEYKYAVSTVSASGEESGFAFSNHLEKDMYIESEITITTNSSYVPQEVLVSLVNINDPEYSYSALSSETGEVSFSDLKRGIYNIKATHRNFHDYNDILDFHEQADVEITLSERALPPGRVVVQLQDALTSKISWADPNSMITLSFDNGTCENGVTPYAYDNLWLGNGFVIPFPVTIESIDVYSMANPEGIDAWLTIDFFDHNLEFVGTSEPFMFNDDDWVNVLVPSFEFSGEGLFVMVHWFDIPGQTHFLGIDQNGPYADTNASVSFNGVQWGYTQPLFPGVFMVRANVLTTEGRLTLEPMEAPLEGLESLSDFCFSEKESLHYPYATGQTAPAIKDTESVAVYNIFRLLNGQEDDPDAWVTVASELDGLDVYDHQWGFLQEGIYRYAVQAVYPSGVSSGFVLSGNIESHGPVSLFTVSFDVTNLQGEPLTDAIVTFNNVENSPGVYVFDDLAPGTYQYLASKEGYHDAAGEVTVEDEDVQVNVVMVGENETLYSVTFQVSDKEGNPVTDAVITFNGTEYPEGIYVMENVYPGTYDYSIAKEGYLDVTGEVTVSDDDVIVSVILGDPVSAGYLTSIDLDIFPNPANTVVNIHSNKMLMEIRLLDQLGQLIHTARVEDKTYELNVSGIKSGIYFISVISDKGITTKRLQIVR